ncbi:MAG: hypothetical protein PHU21_04510 [Elusimicrobia bacterium]|nr:hypothetical protein [Elusimicrobiota bacterium]
MRIFFLIFVASFAAHTAWAAQPPDKGMRSDSTDTMAQAEVSGDHAEGRSSSGMGLKRFLELSESTIKGSRKLNIEPGKQADGIKTGLIMAYGHIIRPPYKIEWKNDRLLVNGVQVIPSLIRQREKTEPPPQYSDSEEKQSRRRKEVKDSIREIYRNKIARNPRGEVKKEIMAYLARSTDVFQNPVWISEDELYIQEAETQIRHSISFEGPPPPSESEKKNNLVKARASYAQSIIKGLQQGAFIMFYSSGGNGSGRDPRQRVNKIMQEPGLSRDQRIELLKEKVFRNYDPALDVIENYNQDEWKQETK